MARWWRWLVVLVAVGILLATPTVLGLLPGRAAAIPAAELLARIGRSAGTPYSGYASATGGLSIPVTGELDSVTRLLGGPTLLRVWWRSPSDWRVDSLATTGESGSHRTPTALWTWDYENNLATLDEGLLDQAARLPVAADLLPPGLARRMLSDATAAVVSPLPSRRVAGRDTQPASARVRDRAVPDLVAFISRFGGVVPPVTLVGLPRNDRLRPYGAVGVYGRGLTEVVAVPLPGGQARELRRRLATAPGVSTTGVGVALTVGPLGLLLTTADPIGDAWLLTGTVTRATLTAAATELRRSSGALR